MKRLQSDALHLLLSFVMPIQCACGSFADPDYAGLLYPRGFAADLKLSAYAMWFGHLEVNATYYALPKAALTERWVAQTPDSFFFDVRLHRAMAQSPRKSAENHRLLDGFRDGLRPLVEAGRLGALLLVLPPNFAPPRHHLEELDGLVEFWRPHPLAIELRHRAWVSASTRATTLAWFRKQEVAWVAVDMPRLPDSDLMPPVDEVTRPELAYLRLHGRNPRWAAGQSAAEKHAYAYTDDDLRDIVRRVKSIAAKAKNVRVVANNHFQDYAPRTALALKDILSSE